MSFAFIAFRLISNGFALFLLNFKFIKCVFRHYFIVFIYLPVVQRNRRFIKICLEDHEIPMPAWPFLTLYCLLSE